MDILSLQFVCFTSISLVVFYLIPPGWQKKWLLLVSVVFYLFTDIRFFLVFLLLTGTNFALAKGYLRKPGNRYIIAGLLINILVFIGIKILTGKYPDILLGKNHWLSGTWLLPVGFSFYVLQMVSFLIEIKKGRITRMPSFLTYSLYLLFFPKVLSGPIEKPVDFLKKLDAVRVVDNAMVSRAAGLITLGILRKLLIANLLAPHLPAWTEAPGLVGWPQVVANVLLIYNDFAGYTLIMRGVSCLFGIELPSNFQQPFFSRNFSELWARWHISLSTWLRETIYFPLSRGLGRHEGKILRYLLAVSIPPMVTMLVSGFWHGASLAMILWGLLLGACLVLERLVYDRWPVLRPQNRSIIFQVLSMGAVSVLYTLVMVPFSAGLVKPTLVIWSNLFLRPFTGINNVWVWLILPAAFSFVLDLCAEVRRSELWWEGLPVNARSVVIALGLLLLVFAIQISAGTSAGAFIYQGF